MAAQSGHLFQLQQIREKQLSEEEAEVVSLWASALELASRDSAAEAARQIDRFCPPPLEVMEESEQTADFLWTLWNVMLDIARSPDVTNEIQERIVGILLELRKIDRGTVWMCLGDQRMWNDLPEFGTSLSAIDDDPTLTEYDSITEQSAQRWLKFVEFQARLTEADAAGLYTDALLVLRLALEEPLPTAAAEEAVTDCRVQAASLWLSRCAKILYDWAQENSDPDLPPEQGTSYFAAGTLYSGRPFVCPERWDFWLLGLEELGKADSSLRAHTRASVLHAAQAMRTVQVDTTKPSESGQQPDANETRTTS